MEKDVPGVEPSFGRGKGQRVRNKSEDCLSPYPQLKGPQKIVDCLSPYPPLKGLFESISPTQGATKNCGFMGPVSSIALEG